MKHNEFSTKRDYEQALMELCLALKPYYTEDCALLNLGVTGAVYDETTIGMEAFARPLWGLVPFFAAGGESSLLSIIQQGLIHGTDPACDNYWGDLGDDHQAFVEMAVLGLGLLLIPDQLWEVLDEKEKGRLNTWLLQINQYSLPKNNWYFFRVLVNAGLMNVGGEYSDESMKDALTQIDSYYLGDGWYSDGKTDQRDYYISFALHFYSLIYAKIMGEKDPQRAGTMINRAKLFAQDFIYWFADGGEALPYGRSLTYRFAQCAFFSALAFAEVEVFSWGVVKGIINRHMRSWFRKPILDRSGILTIGYGYPNLNMAEGYNAPGSPYWSMKSFLILALPENHAYWQAKEEPLPELLPVRVLKHAGMILMRQKPDQVVALTSGQYPGFDPVHSAEKYAKFAYSTYFGFHVPRSYHSLAQTAPDNMLAFYRDELYHVRRRCEEVRIDGEMIWSRWSPMKGIVVETELKPFEEGHLRSHRIQADFDCEAVECGFALPTDGRKPIERTLAAKGITLSGIMGKTQIQLREGEGEVMDVRCEPNTNLLYPRTVLPYIHLRIKKGITNIAVYVTAARP